MILHKIITMEEVRRLEPQFFDDMMNIQQNRRIQNGTYGRIITDADTIDSLTHIVDRWIKR